MLPPPAARRAILAAALVALSAFASVSVAAGSSGTLLVGYAPGSAPPAAIAAAGDVVAIDPALGLAVVRAGDTSAALALLAGAPGVDFAELDATVTAAGVRESAAAADSTRWDASSWDSARWDSARWDSARWDSARWDSARWDSARWDSARWDSARWDSSRWDSSRWDASGWEASGWDSSRWDSSRWDALLPDSSRWDSSRWDSSRWDSSRWDSSRWDGSPLVPDPLLPYQWGLADMNVPDAWATTTGTMSRTVCVVDSGVDATHPDLMQQMWTAEDGTHGRNFLGEPTDTSDHAGHGTHVAGVAAAAVGNGYGVAGVANARIMAVKVLNDQGIGGLGPLAQGIQWCADHGANVISLSLSTEQDSKAVRRAVEHAQAAGALLVASAGNRDGPVGAPDAPVYPAAYPGVVGVAALDLTRAPAAFSRAGAWVDLAAPGELIAGPLPGFGFALGTGTSQATALVAGAALLVWDHEPSLSAAQVAQRLATTAQDVGAPGADAATGAGEPDLAAALQGA